MEKRSKSGLAPPLMGFAAAAQPANLSPEGVRGRSERGNADRRRPAAHEHETGGKQPHDSFDNKEPSRR